MNLSSQIVPQSPALGVIISGTPAPVMIGRGDGVGRSYLPQLGPSTSQGGSSFPPTGMGTNIIAPVIRQQQRSCLVVLPNTIGQETSPFYYGASHAHKLVPCSFNKCRVCPLIDDKSTVTSYAANKQFAAVRKKECSCQDTNLVYVITCKRCGYQYVGETKRTLRTRMNEHLLNIKKNISTSFLVEHFNQPSHEKDKDISVTIIEKMDENASDKDRLTREQFWILALVSAFPFGLNDKITGYGNISSGMNPLDHKAHPYFQIKLPKRPRTHGNKKRRTNSHRNQAKIATKLDLLNKLESPRRIYVELNALNKKELTDLYQIVMGNMNELTKDKFLCVQAIVASRCFKNKKPETVKKTYLPISFPNKSMDLIKLPTILKDKRITKLLNPIRQDLGRIYVTYNYARDLGSLYFTHGKELSKLSNGKLWSLLNNKCNCSGSKFNYGPLGHIVTGDLDVVPNEKLRCLLKMGAKYRPPVPLNWNDSANAIDSGIIAFLTRLTTKYKLNPGSALEISHIIKRIVSNRIKFFEQHTDPNQQGSPVNINSLKGDYRKFASQFILAPADKATANFIVICKAYYFQVLAKEMGLSAIGNQKFACHGNNVYEPMLNTEPNTLIKQHIDISLKYGVTVPESDNKLAKIFCVPKLHKTPYKFRFIAGAKNCSTKPLSLFLASVLKKLKSHFYNYCAAASRSMGFMPYWSTTGSLQVLQSIRNVNQVKHITTADFSTLYTSLPHDIIRKELNYLVSLMFANADKKFLCMGYKSQFYSDTYDSKYTCLSKFDVFELIDIIISNTYVTFGDFIFRQVSGVPMGGNASPLLADLTLSVMEYRFLKSSSYIVRKNLRLSWRYFDDLLCFNNKEFLTLCKNIYPDELPLEETSTDCNNCYYLDMQLTSINDKLNITLYNKVDAFNFAVIRFPHASSNVSNSLGYCTFYSQLIRIGRICSSVTEFKLKLSDLYNIFKSKGFSPILLLHQYKRFVNTYTGIAGTFGLHPQQLWYISTSIFI